MLEGARDSFPYNSQSTLYDVYIFAVHALSRKVCTVECDALV